ncbi:hypothetical protein [Chengkuizengella marina]|uniref:HK97 gp10 family phage protein n=1 Tax=Chengkuizengella marina TaxID=2507566 RepID=A0A6N9Q0A3_9BACL|nr:hypothetical protein [Chengkuizengella marina]NBI28596.1 hypothetical protein [Chengkuizengella marina]
MPKDFTNLGDLTKYLSRQITESLNDNVAKAAVKTMQEEIEDEVYDAYSPKVYERKYYQDGLIDEDNIETKMIDAKTLEIQNVRSDGDKNVAYIVETGEGYTYDVPKELTDGRPFTQETKRRLKEEGIAKQAMKDGLHQRGMDARN